MEDKLINKDMIEKLYKSQEDIINEKNNRSRQENRI